MKIVMVGQKNDSLLMETLILSSQSIRDVIKMVSEATGIFHGSTNRTLPCGWLSKWHKKTSINSHQL